MSYFFRAPLFIDGCVTVLLSPCSDFVCLFSTLYLMDVCVVVLVSPWSDCTSCPDTLLAHCTHWCCKIEDTDCTHPGEEAEGDLSDRASPCMRQDFAVVF